MDKTRFYSKYDPFYGVINHIFENQTSTVGGITNETDQSYTLKFIIPGVPKDKLKIKVDGKTLFVEHQNGDENVDHITPSFKKQYKLPDDCDKKKITSKLEYGILTITIPKREDKTFEKIITIEG